MITCHVAASSRPAECQHSAGHRASLHIRASLAFLASAASDSPDLCLDGPTDARSRCSYLWLPQPGFPVSELGPNSSHAVQPIPCPRDSSRPGSSPRVLRVVSVMVKLPISSNRRFGWDDMPGNVSDSLPPLEYCVTPIARPARVALVL